MTDAYARAGDPDTSHAAARAVQLTELQTTVFVALQGFGQGGATEEQVSDRTGLERVSVSPRFKPLARLGIIECIGERVGRSGRNQKVWRALEIPN